MHKSYQLIVDDDFRSSITSIHLITMKYPIIIIVLTLIFCNYFAFSSEITDSSTGTFKADGGGNENKAIIDKLIIDELIIDNGRKPSASDEEKLVIGKVKLLSEAKEYNQAIEILEDAITEKSSLALSAVKGSMHGKSEEYELAALEFEKVLDKFPNLFSIQKTLGFVYANLENFDDARKHLLRAIELGGEDAKLYGLIGYSYKLKEEWFLAEMFFREAFKREPAEPYWKDHLNGVIEEQNEVRSASEKTSG